MSLLLLQANVAHRLGPANIFNAKHCSIHWVLDLVNPHHEEVAKKLVAMATASGELPNLWNIRMRGERWSHAAGPLQHSLKTCFHGNVCGQDGLFACASASPEHAVPDTSSWRWPMHLGVASSRPPLPTMQPPTSMRPLRFQKVRD